MSPENNASDLEGKITRELRSLFNGMNAQLDMIGEVVRKALGLEQDKGVEVQLLTVQRGGQAVQILLAHEDGAEEYQVLWRDGQGLRRAVLENWPTEEITVQNGQNWQEQLELTIPNLPKLQLRNTFNIFPEYLMPAERVGLLEARMNQILPTTVGGMEQYKTGMTHEMMSVIGVNSLDEAKLRRRDPMSDYDGFMEPVKWQARQVWAAYKIVMGSAYGEDANGESRQKKIIQEEMDGIANMGVGPETEN